MAWALVVTKLVYMSRIWCTLTPPHLPHFHAGACNSEHNSKSHSPSATSGRNQWGFWAWDFWSAQLQDWQMLCLQAPLPGAVDQIWRDWWRNVLVTSYGTCKCLQGCFRLPSHLSEQAWSSQHPLNLTPSLQYPKQISLFLVFTYIFPNTTLSLYSVHSETIKNKIK